MISTDEIIFKNFDLGCDLIKKHNMLCFNKTITLHIVIVLLSKLNKAYIANYVNTLKFYPVTTILLSNSARSPVLKVCYYFVFKAGRSFFALDVKFKSDAQQSTTSTKRL
jgi:hypothetical protein